MAKNKKTTITYVLLSTHTLATGEVLKAGDEIELSETQAENLVGKIRDPSEVKAVKGDGGALQTELDAANAATEALQTQLDAAKGDGNESELQTRLNNVVAETEALQAVLDAANGANEDLQTALDAEKHMRNEDNANSQTALDAANADKATFTAEQLWDAYSEAVGGKTFEGKPLPKFSKLGKQQVGWLAIADTVNGTEL